MHINNNTGPWFESIADSNQGHTGHILSTHFPGYLSPTTRINLSLSLLKLCFQAGSFEYNYVEFFFDPKEGHVKTSVGTNKGVIG